MPEKLWGFHPGFWVMVIPALYTLVSAIDYVPPECRNDQKDDGAQAVGFDTISLLSAILHFETTDCIFATDFSALLILY